MKHMFGFTLIEMVATVAVAAILVTIGVPTFQEIMRSNQVATQTNAFVGALNLARSEAIKSGSRVTLCKSADGTSCSTTGGYEQGWMVFVDADADLVPDRIIRVYEKMASGITLTGPSVNGMHNYVSYVGSGLNRSNGGAIQMGTFSLCNSPELRKIIINSTGRVRIDKPAAVCS